MYVSLNLLLWHHPQVGELVMALTTIAVCCKYQNFCKIVNLCLYGYILCL